MTRLRTIRIVLWVLVAIAGLSAVALATGLVLFRELSPSRSAGVADIGGPFRMTTHKGEALTDANMRGAPFLLFFGFTHCPDVCPTTLGRLSMLYEELGADADKLKTLFVTVDPERDTQQTLADYMQAFDPRIVALRGSPAETEAIGKAYKGYIQKVAIENGDYTMDHSTTVYMMDADGRFVGTLDVHEGEEVQLAKLRRLLGSS